MATTRRGKWHQPPAQTPRILNLPRRNRSTRTSRTKPDQNLISLFELEKQVRAESAPVSPPHHCDEDSGEEKWRFQADMLRAECSFLRMEREVAVRKLDRQWGHMEAALKSAMETLVSGRKKIDGTDLDVEIQDLEEMLDGLQMEKDGGRRSFQQLQRCRGRNFDRQASSLRKRLEKMPVNEEVSVKEIREITLPVVNRHEKALSYDEIDQVVARTEDPDENVHTSDVEVLKRKMEGLSKGMVERMVEYGFMPSWRQQQVKAEDSEKVGTERSSCGCREIVGKIMEQVKVESEQWTEMQAMLEQVRQEMLELQASRDLWQCRAIASDVNVRSLHAQVLEWKHRARVSENNVEELQKRILELQNRLKNMKIEHLAHKTSQEDLETCKSNMKINSERRKTISDHKRGNEKQIIVRQLKKLPSYKAKRSPFTEISNFEKQ